MHGLPVVSTFPKNDIITETRQQNVVFWMNMMRVFRVLRKVSPRRLVLDTFNGCCPISRLRAIFERERFAGKVTDSPHEGHDAKLQMDVMPRGQAHVDCTFNAFFFFWLKDVRALLSTLELLCELANMTPSSPRFLFILTRHFFEPIFNVDLASNLLDMRGRSFVLGEEKGSATEACRNQFEMQSEMGAKKTACRIALRPQR